MFGVFGYLFLFSVCSNLGFGGFGDFEVCGLVVWMLMYSVGIGGI